MPKSPSGFLVDVTTRSRLEFQYNPSEIIDEKGVVYAGIRVPGLSDPVHQFVTGEPRKIAFTLKLFKGEVRKNVSWLQSFLYPEHNGQALKHAPHQVLLIMGDLYPGTTCVVRQVKTKFHGLFDTRTLSPQQADVEISLEEWVSPSRDMKEVRQ